jgi:hypothetical protein
VEILTNSEGNVIEIETLERQILSLVTRGFSVNEVQRRTGLRARSIRKLLENVRRKVEFAQMKGSENYDRY